MLAAARRWNFDHLKVVPRCMRACGCTFLHVVHGWGLAELVPRGRWARYESTASYLNAGLYAALAFEVPPSVRREARAAERAWPRSLYWPSELIQRLPAEYRGWYRPDGSGGWGRDQMDRNDQPGGSRRVRHPCL